MWAGFAASYEVVRGLASGNRTIALANAHTIISFEQRLHGFFEPSVQRDVLDTHLVIDLAHWTYWLAQFAVVGIVVVWIYLRRNDAYPLLRDTLIVTNTLGLIGYLAFPVAPPRLVAGYGFHETFSAAGVLSQQSEVVRLLANPYAAFPSLHAADALVLGVVVFGIARHRLVKLLAVAWPFWVAFSLILSANHFWLDIAAGAALAAAARLAASAAGEKARHLLFGGRSA